jgi:hypothetical protein
MALKETRKEDILRMKANSEITVKKKVLFLEAKRGGSK